MWLWSGPSGAYTYSILRFAGNLNRICSHLGMPEHRRLFTLDTFSALIYCGNNAIVQFPVSPFRPGEANKLIKIYTREYSDKLAHKSSRLTGLCVP